MATTAAVVTAVGAVGGLAVGVTQGRQARKAQGRIRREQEARARLEDIRSRAETVRRARIARAQIANQAALTGTTQSSGAQGGQAGVQSQLGTNLAFLNRTGEIQSNIFNAQNELSQANQRAQIGSAFASLLSASGSVIGALPNTSPKPAGSPAGRHSAVNQNITGALSPTFGL